ncbi:ABC transporter substrate-binding protein [Candidatus Bipolaricaulota bacterium]|nr:ABC transporter substrate-binding protein [Candidatus Bipolaricaulota bacterium]
MITSFRWKIVVLSVLVVLATVQLPLVAGASKPKYGGTLRVALPAEPPGLDPTTHTAAVIDRVLYNNVYQGLVRINRDGEVVPSLARDWEVSEDGTVYTFYLREGVSFHNGKKFTSEDVRFTFERAMSDATTVPHPEYFAPIEKIEAPSTTTVRINLSRPSSIFLFNLARGDAVILPRGVEGLSSRPVGTGPFKFKTWKRGSNLSLTSYEDYYDRKLPYLEEVIFEFIGDVNTRITSLKSGGIDAIAYLSSPENAVSLKELGSIKVLTGVTTWEVILAMNNSRKPFSDPLVRKAINYALDRKEIIEGATFGFGKPIGSLMSPTNPNHLDLSWLYPHEPEKARKLLKESGYPDGFEATLTLPATYELSLRSGKIVADQVKKVGIDLKIEKISWAQWLQRVFTNAEYDLTIIGHSEAFDISIYGDPNYYFNYDNERLQRVLEKAERETDEKTRSQLYSVAQWIIAEDVPSAFLFSAPSLPAMRNEIMNWWKDYPIPAVDVTEVWIDD